MNVLEEQALIDDLHRRGDHRVDATSPSCTVEQYRAAARRIGRQHQRRIRTFVSDARSVIWMVWTDREQTALGKRAAMIALGSGRNYNDVLEEARRQNLKPVGDGESHAD